MLKFAFIILASAMMAGCVSSESGNSQASSTLLKHSVTYYYKPQTKHVRSSCMPVKLLKILGHIREKTGVKPILTSADRSGGRKGSMHHGCRAADIRVPGVSDAQVIKIARTAPGIGGIGQYCTGIIHVDIGSRREWKYCGKNGKNHKHKNKRKRKH